MRIYSIYFSPTGGTQKVMDILTETFALEDRIDLTVPDRDYSAYSFQRDDVCFVGVPSYSGRVPAVALKRIKEMKGNGALAIAVVVYGNCDFEDALLELKNETETCGFRPGTGVAAIAEHSMIRQYAVGRPDDKDRETLRICAAFIRDFIEDDWSRIQDYDVPGNFPYKEYADAPMKPEADNSCTRCGLCVERCPVGAIPKKTPASVDENKCISCMRCISICPKDARKPDLKALFAVFAASYHLANVHGVRKNISFYCTLGRVRCNKSADDG